MDDTLNKEEKKIEDKQENKYMVAVESAILQYRQQYVAQICSNHFTNILPGIINIKVILVVVHTAFTQTHIFKSYSGRRSNCLLHTDTHFDR